MDELENYAREKREDLRGVTTAQLLARVRAVRESEERTEQHYLSVGDAAKPNNVRISTLLEVERRIEMSLAKKRTAQTTPGGAEVAQ